jgi:hypothetical protein
MTVARASTRILLSTLPAVLCVSAAVLALTRPLAAQSLDDGMLVPRHEAMIGAFYGHDSWTNYWEGTVKRSNGNIGTLTTQTAAVSAGFGLTSRISLLASLPYVATRASQGTLRGQRGVQDLTIAAKLRLFSSDSAGRGLSAFVVAAGAAPMSHYTPDFMPLSIGTAGTRASTRLTLGYVAKQNWFASASGGYTFCNNVKLDRSSYYTDGQLYLTNEVAMPNVTDYVVVTGLRFGRFELPVSYTLQHMLGGADIRRQDMPFVSDRMDFTRVGGELRYAVSGPRNLSLRVGAAHVLTGRNVGQSTTITSGLVYALPF